MCAIFGSNKFSTYQKLYDLCKERGDFAYGSLYTGFRKEGRYVVTTKAEKTVTLSNKDSFLFENKNIAISKLDFFLGHTQAPTSSKRTYDEKTSHPFKGENWVVAHNGVLTNFNKLKKIINNKKKYCEVDSSIIPALLDQFSQENENEVSIISETLSLLEGTFGVWIYSLQSGSIYLARSGSTLYADFLTNSFSSLPYNKFVSLEEGNIYTVTSEGLTTVGGFDNNSPFFIL
jgi:glucosamine 6-phosphate synthetase-like amidotransferase/phosphosugar isomerase protein